MVASPTLNNISPSQSAQFAQQLGNLSLFVRREGPQRGRGNLGRDGHGFLRHAPSTLGQRDSPPAPILWVVERCNKAAQMQPIDDPLDGGGVEIDQPAKVIL